MTERAGSGFRVPGSGNNNSEKITVAYERAMVDPVTIFPEPCTGCNRCVTVCPVDLFLPNPVRGGPPLVVFPGECWFEGSCVDICPEPGAIVLNRPFVSRVNWKLKNEGTGSGNDAA
jgi:NAD-dependent dihydropyrimidine dehydrogenase PreA subunit